MSRVRRRRSERHRVPIVAAEVLVGALALALSLAACESGPTDGRSGSRLAPAAGASTPGTAAGTVPSSDASAPGGPIPGAGRGRPGLPDRKLTPGAMNPVVTQANLRETACRSGWSKSVRPPVSYTGTLKRAQIREYGYTDLDPRHYQEDHLVPLSIGGAPRDPANLWPEPMEARLPDGTPVGAETKDRFELWLHERLCAGRIGLGEAQRQMAVDWIAAWEAAGRP